MVTLDTPPTLCHVCVYNSKFSSSEETAYDQILYFSNPQTTKNEQLREIGLAQAIVNFSQYV